MNNYIGTTKDMYGNIVYVIDFDENSVELEVGVQDAIILSEDDKKKVKKILRKKSRPNIEYIKLEDFELLTNTTYNIISNYENNFLDDIMKYLERKDDMSLTCIEQAKNDLTSIRTFKEFGEMVAKILIEKYDLKEKEQR